MPTLKKKKKPMKARCNSTSNANNIKIDKIQITSQANLSQEKGTAWNALSAWNYYPGCLLHFFCLCLSSLPLSLKLSLSILMIFVKPFITLIHFIFILFASILLFSAVHTLWYLFSLAFYLFSFLTHIFILVTSILFFSPVHTPWSLFSLARPPPLASSEPHNQSHHKMNHFVIIEGIHHDDEQDDAVIEHLLITSIACLGPNPDPGSHVVVVETCVKTSCSSQSSSWWLCDGPYVDGVDNDIIPNLIMMMLKMIYRKGWKESCHQKRKEEYWSCTCRCRSVKFDFSQKSKYKYTHCDVI